MTVSIELSQVTGTSTNLDARISTTLLIGTENLPIHKEIKKMMKGDKNRITVLSFEFIFRFHPPVYFAFPSHTRFLVVVG
jgi:hypothetical protein